MTAQMGVERVATTDSVPAKTNWNWKVWWAGSEKNRGDLIRSDGNPAGARVCQIQGCERVGWYLDYVESSHICARFLPTAPSPDSFAANADPRFFGYTTAPAGVYRGQTFVPLGRTDRTDVRVREVVLEQVTAYEMTWKTLEGAERKIIVRPDKGWNVHSIETKYSVKDKKYIETLAVDLAAIGIDPVWFPSKVTISQTIDGALNILDTIVFTNVTINQPIPPETFTLAGAGIPEGQLFCLTKASPEAPYGRLSNGKLVKDTEDSTAFNNDPPVAVGSPTGPVNYWLIALCVFCSFGAIAVLLLRRRRNA